MCIQCCTSREQFREYSVNIYGEEFSHLSLCRRREPNVGVWVQRGEIRDLGVFFEKRIRPWRHPANVREPTSRGLLRQLPLLRRFPTTSSGCCRAVSFKFGKSFFYTRKITRNTVVFYGFNNTTIQNLHLFNFLYTYH